MLKPKTIEVVFCKCGCCKTRPRYDINGRELYYINGHQGRGKKRSEAFRLNQSIAPIKEETKRKISLFNMGKKPTNKNIPHSLKTKRKMSESMRLWWDNRRK